VTAVIAAVFFDFGGVILSSPFDAFASYEHRSGLPAGFLRRLNSTNPDTNAWARLERSEVSLGEFAEIFEHEALELGHRVDGREVLGCLRGELRPAMVSCVEQCFELLTTVLVTNNFMTAGGDLGPGVERRLKVLDSFHHIIESSRVGVRKPDERFYALACEVASVEPAEVVFLDDLGVNLKPARALGMTTIKVGDPDAAIKELGEILGIDFAP
jgi:putative hydrolase of the HAD superfamily